ncbi:MAG: efflux RND transporter periplasmic adaptor subunit [Alistipes sp.]|nr:efflux RND transporter periplasmic adaptor subunit [Alistipes sp.]
MCRFYFILFLVVVANSCARHKGKENSPIAVKVTRVEMVDYIERDFAGMATADDAVNLAFKISGQILSVDVSKGDYVKKGELLARLDPRDVELQKAADRSQFERAKSQYERMQRLLDHEAVSQQEYESARAQYVQAQSAYENSKDLLSETNLRAPFGGVIERTYVDTYQRVQSGQTILRLVNPMSTTVEFTMPEKSLPLLFDSTIRFSVIFDNIPNRQFVARLDTYAKTSSDASGFPVSLKIERDEAERYRISPGMTCQVMMHTQGKGARQSTLVVPLSAIYAPASGGEYVWRVTSDGRVKLSPVTLGEVYGRDMVSITSGLAAGAEIVTAGVYKLRDGDIVKPINR